MTAPLPPFPAGFLWGVSASAFQIEGSVTADGRGPSSWDAFTKRRGAVKDGSHADVATDHYRRYREDVALMAGLGVGAYRFSVSWSRVLPEGAGRVNRKGLDFYDRLVDELCAAGIAPAPTLFHWDTPLALEERGGWLSRDTAERFASYASVVAERLADRVPMWITINEPAEVTLLGYGLGEHAPASAWSSTRCRWRTTSSSPTAWPCRRCAPPVPARSASPPRTAPCGPPGTARRTGPPPSCTTRSPTASSPIPS